MQTRAVVFDLWYTLVTPEETAFREARIRFAEKLGTTPERIDELWSGEDAYRKREAGPLRAALEELNVALGGTVDVEDILDWRLELMRTALRPDPGVVETLAELRRRGLSIGLVSNCTEDVPLVWDESPFAGLIDAPVFSATAGLVKPDPRIYELACTRLGIEANACLYIGDGANDELQGAGRVGMTPVLVLPSDRPAWDGLESWSGLRVASIPQVLELLE